MKLTLQWRWFGGLAALWLALLTVIYASLNLTLPSYLVDRIRADLERDARCARQCFLEHLTSGCPSTVTINSTAHALARETGLRVSVIGADGTPVGAILHQLREDGKERFIFFCHTNRISGHLR